MVPYTYLIGWKKYNTYYYGVRYAKNCDPSELWVTYKTSSKYVKSFISSHGNPDIIEIRKIFSCPNKARLWEHKVLKKINAVTRLDFLNKTDNKAIDTLTIKRGSEHPNWGKVFSEDLKVKLRIPKSEKTKENMRGKRPHINQTGKFNNAFKGIIVTPYGKFESLQKAAFAENIHLSTISLRINNKNFDGYYRKAI